MPYLLDLPPLDNETQAANKATVTEIQDIVESPTIKSKSAIKKKVAAKDTEADKWPSLIIGSEPERAIELPKVNTDSETQVNCDNKHKQTFDFQISKNNMFVSLTDSDMERLRWLSQRLKVVEYKH